MSNSILLDKSKALALEVIRLCNEVKKILITSINTAKTNNQSRGFKSQTKLSAIILLDKLEFDEVTSK